MDNYLPIYTGTNSGPGLLVKGQGCPMAKDGIGHKALKIHEKEHKMTLIGLPGTALQMNFD